MRAIGPRTVATLVRAAVEKKQWELVARNEDLAALGAGGGCITPLRGLLRRNGRAWGPHERQKLRLAITGAVWGPLRRWQHGWQDRPNCPACGSDFGSVRHLVWQCAAGAVKRRQWSDAALGPPAQDWVGDPLWSMCLMSSPFTGIPAPLDRRDPWAAVTVVGPSAGWPLTGTVYTDASGMYGRERSIRRIVWRPSNWGIPVMWPLRSKGHTVDCCRTSSRGRSAPRPWP